MSTDEEKYKKLRESLRTLPRIRAKKDFEDRLFKRIHEHKSAGTLHAEHVKTKENSLINFLANLLRPSLAPAIGLTVVLLAAIVVYFAYFNELKKDTSVQNEYSTGQKNGEFVIYVKKDGERVNDETARELATMDQTTQPSTMFTQTEHSTDAYPRPEEAPVLRDVTRDVKDDDISPQQKTMMEREVETDKEERKTEPKKDDGIMMKKSSKVDSKESPSNIRSGEEDTGSKDNGYYNKQENENDEINQQTEGKSVESQKNRISRTKNDSLKAKDKKVEDQKDSMEK